MSLCDITYLFFQINKIFPEIPVSLLDIERNQSVAFLNSHFSMFDQTRMLPNQIEMGGVHCKPGKPLPKVSVMYSTQIY